MIPAIAIKLGLAFITTLLVGRFLIKDKVLRKQPESILSNAIFVYIISLKLSLLFTNFSSVQNELLYLLYGWGSGVNQALATIATSGYFFWYLKSKSENQKLEAIFLGGSSATFIGVFIIGAFFINDLDQAQKVDVGFLNVKTDIEGSTIEVNEGNIILNFWATWCPPCKAEMPDLNAFAQNYSKANFISVNNITSEKNGLEGVKLFLKTKSYNFTVIADYENKLSSKFNVSSFPTTIVISPDGDILAKKVGVVSESWLKSWLD